MQAIFKKKNKEKFNIETFVVSYGIKETTNLAGSVNEQINWATSF